MTVYQIHFCVYIEEFTRRRNVLLAKGNPFISAYMESDWFGRGIFWGLIFLSIISWSLLSHKIWIFFHVKRLSLEFKNLFSEQDPLGLQFYYPLKKCLIEIPHPFFEIYKTLKKNTLQMLQRNHAYAPEGETTLSSADLGLIESQLRVAIIFQIKKLEQNLFVLSTVVSLAPFLGLLGTVWGILMAFDQMYQKGVAATGNSSMLSGISLALSTTVIGLLVAIPALVGYNYIKNGMRNYRREIEGFAHLLLVTIELHYRRPEQDSNQCVNSPF